MAITSADVSKLRAQTGAGMMDCKNALEEAGGDAEKAADLLRKKGIVKAAKRADKIAADGKIVAVVSADQKRGAVVEVNSETDFVAKSDGFIKFAKDVSDVVESANPADLGALLKLKLVSGKTVDEEISELTLKIGEKIGVRRFTRYETADGVVAIYLHGSKIGTMVEISGNDHGLALDIAMHIAAANPKYLTRDQVDSTEIEKEKSVYSEQLKAQGKPANIIENIVKGKLDKFYGEICLLEQAFIKDEEKTVKQLVEKAGATIKRFVR
ncbi:MAG: translation elongation factor Ts, partial [Candidatus Magasanikbacteria bacterium]